MWSVSEQNGEYIITDHNGTERGRLPADDGISGQDVKDVMRQRSRTLEQKAVGAIANQNVTKGVAVATEWVRIVGDMAGDQIQLPQPEDGQP